MPTLLIHTGGTIGMVRSQHGYAPSAGVLEAEVGRLKKSSQLADRVDFLPLEPLIDSANAKPSDWSRIASVIIQQHDVYDGFVVTHGTDTLAYSAAALCFALQGLTKPVIVTGSMLPLAVEGNDGHRNLQDALNAVPTAGAGVWVQFAERLLHGARVTKAHSHAQDAFTAAAHDAPPVHHNAELRLHAYGLKKISVLTVSPGSPGELFEHAMEILDGVVLRCFGAGTAPDDPVLIRALRVAQKREIPVIAVSQCPEGGLDLHSYAAGATLRDNGVIDGRDMTYQAAYAKLHHVLTLGLGQIALREKIANPIAGEMRK